MRTNLQTAVALSEKVGERPERIGHVRGPNESRYVGTDGRDLKGINKSQGDNNLAQWKLADFGNADCH